MVYYNLNNKYYMKYFVTDTRTEVKPGEVFKMCTRENGPYGECTKTMTFTLTEENIALLVKEGILIASETAPIPMNVAFYCAKLKEKLGWKDKKLCHILGDLSEVHLGVVFSLLLKEIAIVMDKNYSDHISKSKTFFYVSMIDGTIQSLREAPTFTQHVALFRTKQEAYLAVKILKDLHKSMFPKLYAE